MFIARVDTNYVTYALGKTESEARRLALASALKWLQARGAERDPGKPYTTQKQVEDNLGCNIWEVQPGTAIQEY